MNARLELTDGLRHVTTKPADLAGHPVVCGCASPLSGPASRTQLRGRYANLAPRQVLLQ